MRRVIFFAVMVAFLSSVSPAITNLVQNGDFDSGDADWDWDANAYFYTDDTDTIASSGW